METRRRPQGQCFAVWLMFLPLLFTNCSEVGFKEKKKISSCEEESCSVILQGEEPTSIITDDPTIETPEDPGFSIVDEVTDVEVAAPLQKVDVLLVIDDSKSMRTERRELASRMAGFTEKLDAEGIDWRMCHITTDIYNGAGKARRWVGLGSRILTSTTRNRAEIFRSSIEDLPSGSGDEMGIRATYTSLQLIDNIGCFRSDAALAVILLSDEDERSCGGRNVGEPGFDDCRELSEENMPEALVGYVGEEFPGKPFTFHSLIVKPSLPDGSLYDVSCYDEQIAQENHPAYYGVRYAETSLLTGGQIGSVCADSYTNELTRISQNIKQSLVMLPLKCSPAAGTLSVSIFDGSDANVTGSYSYTLVGNRLEFSPALPAGFRVYAEYGCPVFL